MFALPGLKHNRFVQVDIPKPSELFKATGGKATGVSYSGDEYVPQDSNKVEEAVKVNKEIDQFIQEQQDNKEE